MSAASAAALGRAADLLTLARLAVAPTLMATLAAGRLAAAAALLAGAWLTDALDGPAARAAELQTRLGRFDLVVDTAVGAGALAGLALAGDVPATLAGTLLAVLGTGFLVLRNPALSMALQAVGYAWFLWTLWDEGEPAVWLPVRHGGRPAAPLVPAPVPGCHPRLPRRARHTAASPQALRPVSGAPGAVAYFAAPNLVIFSLMRRNSPAPTIASNGRRDQRVRLEARDPEPRDPVGCANSIPLQIARIGAALNSLSGPLATPFVLRPLGGLC